MMIKFEGQSGKPVHINPALIMMADQGADVDQSPGAPPKVTPLPGITVLIGINAQFNVKGTVENIIERFGGWLLPFKQQNDIVGINPRWVTGVQQNVDEHNTPIIGKVVIATTSGNLVFDGNMGEAVTTLNKWIAPA